MHGRGPAADCGRDARAPGGPPLRLPSPNPCLFGSRRRLASLCPGTGSPCIAPNPLPPLPVPYRTGDGVDGLANPLQSTQSAKVTTDWFPIDAMNTNGTERRLMVRSDESMPLWVTIAAP